MTQPLAQTIFPPIGEVTRSECKHHLASAKDHRCPACQGTLRRCCDSVIGFAHHEFCSAALKRLAMVMVEVESLIE